MEQIVTIELFGQPFTFKAESDGNKAKEVADYLVKEVSKIESQHSEKTSNISKLSILLLAALNIANENFELKQNKNKLIQEVSGKTGNLVRVLNEYVK
ncbi:MAG: cell division protein ZapA [Desulfobacterales bacterium]|nr:cell division protein ZapA [Desulfobacterales bacterium]